MNIYDNVIIVSKILAPLVIVLIVLRILLKLVVVIYRMTNSGERYAILTEIDARVNPNIIKRYFINHSKYKSLYDAIAYYIENDNDMFCKLILSEKLYTKEECDLSMNIDFMLEPKYVEGNFDCQKCYLISKIVNLLENISEIDTIFPITYEIQTIFHWILIARRFAAYHDTFNQKLDEKFYSGINLGEEISDIAHDMEIYGSGFPYKKLNCPLFIKIIKMILENIWNRNYFKFGNVKQYYEYISKLSEIDYQPAAYEQLTSDIQLSFKLHDTISKSEDLLNYFNNFCKSIDPNFLIKIKALIPIRDSPLNKLVNVIQPEKSIKLEESVKSEAI